MLCTEQTVRAQVSFPFPSSDGMDWSGSRTYYITSRLDLPPTPMPNRLKFVGSTRPVNGSKCLLDAMHGA